MHEPDDHELLGEFARNRSESAFAALVGRYVNLVHSTALRFTGNSHHAEEITQAVFIILAQKAGKLSSRVVLSGWLYQVARLTAANLVKGEIRRQRRQQEAYMQSILEETESPEWNTVAPLLDEAMGSLGQTDRDAVVLRYFENKSAAEIGAALRMNEDTARRRVNRAVEKLRKFFTRRGTVIPAVVLTSAISAHSIQAAPLALAKTVIATAITKGAAASASTLILTKGALKIMAWSKAKAAIVATGVILLVGTGAIFVKNDFFPSEPSYQGRRLSDWLSDIDFNQPAEKRRVAGEAIRQMGVRTLPFLLADLGDEKYKRFHYSREDHRTADDRSRQATWGFDALGAVAKPAIPELEKILERNPGYAPLALAGIGPDALPQLLKAFDSENFWVRDNAAAALANAIFSGKITAEEASVALPIAIDNLTYENTNPLFQGNTRFRAATLLGALKQSPDTSVPALIQGLGDTNASVTAECALALSGFGAQAKTAIPELTRLANSTNSFLKDKAQQSLAAIQGAR